MSTGRARLDLLVKVCSWTSLYEEVGGLSVTISLFQFETKTVRGQKMAKFCPRSQKVTKGPKIPLINNMKRPTCASKRDVLELAILRYMV